MREQSDPERPRRGQRQCMINRTHKPNDENKRTIQVLFRDLGVPVSISWKVYRVIFEKLIRASESPPEESRPVYKDVNYDRINNRDKKGSNRGRKREKTYCKKINVIRATSAQQNKTPTVKNGVSDNRDEEGTHPGISQYESDPKRPRNGQNP